MELSVPTPHGGYVVSIVRIGLAENKGFAEGYAAIFGKKKPAEKATEKVADKKAPAAKAPNAKKAPAPKKAAAKPAKKK